MHRLERWFWATDHPQALGVTRAILGAATLLATFELLESVLHVVDGAHLQVPVAEGLTWLYPLLVPAIVVWAIAAGLFALGAWTTVSGWTVVAVGAALFLTDQQLYSNHLLLLCALVGLTTLADGGAALSLDARRRGGPRPVHHGFVWLVKVQLTVVYAFSALSKVNSSFLSGSVVASYMRSDGPLAFPEAWRTFEPMLALSVAVILIEAFIAITLWLPYWRRNALVAGVVLHGGIVAVFEPPLLPLMVFGIASLAPYVLFLDARPGSALVIWDRGCDFCGTWIRHARRLDWLGVLRDTGSDDEAALARLGISREAADAALHVVGTTGTHAGFDAVRSVAGVLPLTFLVAPLLGLPPVRWVGDRVYRRVARNRRCSIVV